MEQQPQISPHSSQKWEAQIEEEQIKEQIEEQTIIKENKDIGFVLFLQNLQSYRQNYESYKEFPVQAPQFLIDNNILTMVCLFICACFFVVLFFFCFFFAD